MLEHLERPVRRLVVVDAVPVVANAADCVLEKVEQHLLALELAARAQYFRSSITLRTSPRTTDSLTFSLSVFTRERRYAILNARH